jgi:Arc/MetJ-type ribon-helix-helix transcriptional regulator
MTTVKLDDELAKQINSKFVGHYGYTSVTDFVRKAVKKRIEELKKQ